MADNQKSISEQALLAMLSELRPVAIIITPQTKEDESIVYAWKAKESHGTHPELLEAVREALEAAMTALAYTPISPEAQLTQDDFPPTIG